MAEVSYIYRVDGEPFLGTKKEPFIFHSSGEEYISHFVTGKELTVRVKPGDPMVSVVNETLPGESKSKGLSV